MHLSKYLIALTISLFIVSQLTHASDENFPQVDSLKNEIAKAVTDSAKVYLWVRVSTLYSSTDVASSIEAAQKALNIANKSENKDLQAYAMFNAGNAFFTQGLFENAANYFYKYLNIQKELANLNGQGFAMANIGAVHLKMENLKEAKSYFIDAIKLLTKYKNEHGDTTVLKYFPNILNNIGIVYQGVHQYDSALHFYRKALARSIEMSQQELFQSNIYNNIGSMFLEAGPIDSAQQPLFRAMQIRTKTNDLYGQAASALRLSDYYFAIGEPQKALQYLYEAYTLSKRTGSTDLKRQSAEKLYLYYNSAQKADSALKHYIDFNHYTDTINNIETQKELVRLKLLSKFEEEQRIAKIEQTRRQTRFLLISVLLILLLLIFILLYFLSSSRLRRVKLERNNLELESKNTELEKKNLENQLEIKKKELTTNILSLIRKNELIRQTIEVLSEKSEMKEPGIKSFIRSIIKDLNQIQDESIWEEFELRYKEVERAFYEKLQEINPNLSTNERRLCAFLRLNMTTKEIASITGQTQRSIEVARTRLRKKLELTNSDTRLSDFLVSL